MNCFNQASKAEKLVLALFCRIMPQLHFFKPVFLLVIGMLLLSLKNPHPKPVVVTYVIGYNKKLIQVETIQAEKLTHILYAFADIKNNRLWLRLPATDTVNLKRLNLLRRKNPAIKMIKTVLLAIGMMKGKRVIFLMQQPESGFLIKTGNRYKPNAIT